MYEIEVHFFLGFYMYKMSLNMYEVSIYETHSPIPNALCMCTYEHMWVLVNFCY